MKEDQARLFEHASPGVGLVVATFAAVPYVHLHLEARRRLYPALTLLVHDDCSQKARELKLLCDHYGADFMSLPKRMNPCVGDMSSYIHGLRWAERLGLELLVKMSRRFVPISNWVPAFQRLAWESSAPTYSNECLHHKYGFRTECIGFHVTTWLRSPALERLEAQVEANKEAFVEGLVHNLAREIHRAPQCAHYLQYVKDNPRPVQSDAYAVWRLMPSRRTEKSDLLLWHDCDGAIDYARLARLWRLPYGTADFADPNQGHGRRPA